MSDLPPTRQSLLLELGKRNDAAWSEFLDVYETAILRYCLSKGLQEADARDATQEVYAAIQQKMSSWDPDSNRGSFRAWLFRVARNISVDLITARSKSEVLRHSGQMVLADVQDHRIEGNDPDALEQSTLFQLQWQKSLFEWACNQVQHEVRATTWQAFCRTAIDGRPAEDVAAELKVPVGSVYTAKCRVMARIRARVEQWSSTDALPGSLNSAD